MSIPLMFWLFIAYVVLQIIALNKLKGGLYKASVASSVLGVIIIALTVFLFFIGSNLFPVYLLFSGPLFLCYIVLLFLINGFKGKKV